MKKYIIFMILFIISISIYGILFCLYMELFLHKKINIKLWVVSLLINIICIIIYNITQKRLIGMITIIFLNLFFLTFFHLINEMNFIQLFTHFGIIRMYLVSLFYVTITGNWLLPIIWICRSKCRGVN
jgi:hypothetical protein